MGEGFVTMKKTTYLEEVFFTDSLPIRVNRYTRNMTTIIQNHYHGELELNLLYEPDSSIDFYVNGEKRTIHTGEVGLINVYDIHSSIPSLPTKGDEITGIKIFIQRDFLDLVFKEYGGYENIRMVIPDREANDRIRDAMNLIAEYDLHTEQKKYRLLILAKICEILAYTEPIERGMDRGISMDSGREIVTYIHEMYQKPLSLSELAEHFHYSKEYFCRVFKKYTGVTFKQYLTGIRLMNAVKLLNSTEKTISEIAQKTGFTDESQLIACFRAHYHQTPGHYRKQLKLLNHSIDCGGESK